MSEMVERVASAIEAAFDKEARVFDQGQAETLARAAIEAMREPTDLMGVTMVRVTLTGEMFGKRTPLDDPRFLDAAEMEVIGFADCLGGNPAQWLKPTWRAAIDAALKE